MSLQILPAYPGLPGSASWLGRTSRASTAPSHEREKERPSMGVARASRRGKRNQVASIGGVGGVLSGEVAISPVELAMDSAMLHPLPHASAWRWLLASLAIFGFYVAALAWSVASLPFPEFSGPNVDWFLSIGWILFAGGVVLFFSASVGLVIRRHPFYEHLLLLYFLSLVLFIAAAVLHTSRLDADAQHLITNPDADAALLCVQLSWAGNILFYIYFSAVVYRAARVHMKIPNKEDRARWELLRSLRELLEQRQAMVEQLAALEAQEKAEAAAMAEADEERAMRQAMAQAHPEQALEVHNYDSPPVLRSPSRDGRLTPSGVAAPSFVSIASPHSHASFADVVQLDSHRQPSGQMHPSAVSALSTSHELGANDPSPRFATPQRAHAEDTAAHHSAASAPSFQARVSPARLSSAAHAEQQALEFARIQSQFAELSADAARRKSAKLTHAHSSSATQQHHHSQQHLQPHSHLASPRSKVERDVEDME